MHPAKAEDAVLRGCQQSTAAEPLQNVNAFLSCGCILRSNVELLLALLLLLPLLLLRLGCNVAAIAHAWYSM
jgi:hypothetical protein